MKKFGLRLTGHRKWYFLIFAIFVFPNFKLVLLKFFGKAIPFLMDFESSYAVLLRHNYF